MQPMQEEAEIEEAVKKEQLCKMGESQGVARSTKVRAAGHAHVRVRSSPCMAVRYYRYHSTWRSGWSCLYILCLARLRFNVA